MALPIPNAPPQIGISLLSTDGPSADEVAPVALDAAPVLKAESEPAAPVYVDSDTQRLARASEGPPSVTPAASPADVLFSGVRAAIQQLLSVPMKDAEVAGALDVSNAQAKAWLQRLVDEGVVERQKEPAGYIVKRPQLFE